MKSVKFISLPIAVAALLVLSLSPLSCGDDSSTDSAQDDDGEDCEPFEECASPIALSDGLVEMEFEVDPDPECAPFGLDVEVLEVRATESRSRMEARIRVAEQNGNTFYLFTLASDTDVAYEDREFCWHEIAGTGTYEVAANFTNCPSSLGIQFWSETTQWECPETPGGQEACLYLIDVLPWPPEGQCVEDPQ